MISSVWHWLNERWPLSSMIRVGREEEIPGGASFAYTLGSATFFVFLLQLLTGIWQIFYYVPSVEHAYDSLNYMRTQIPFGWLVHGLHYWGANAMVVLLVLHMARVFIWGAYKRPRELTWLSGVCLLLLVMGLSFTGAPLPWDQRGYWSVEVGTSIAGSTPIVGDVAERLLRGGGTIGQLTLSRFFVLHAFILPGMLFFMIGFHLIAFRRYGSVGPWNEAKRSRIGQFWPEQIAKDIVVIALLIIVLVGLSAYAPPPITGQADPLDTSFVPRPEWNFLFLYEALKFFPGRLEPIGTVGVPAAIILILVFLPFLDRHPGRNPLHRPVVMAGGLILGVVFVALTFAGLVSRPQGSTEPASASPAGSTVQMSSSARQGARLFHSIGCVGCHRANGVGGKVGPELSYTSLRGKSRQWLVTQILHPSAHNPRSIMPAFYGSLSSRQVDVLADYLLSLATKAEQPQRTTEEIGAKAELPPAGRSSNFQSESVSISTGSPGPAADTIGSAEHGAILFERECASCHGVLGKVGIPNPGSDGGRVPPINPIDGAYFNTEPQLFAENIDRVIQHGAVPPGPNPKVRMPAFGSTHALSQQEIANIEAYILRLNGIERAQIAHPGVLPHLFFYLVTALFGIVGVVLGVAWIWTRRGDA